VEAGARQWAAKSVGGCLISGVRDVALRADHGGGPEPRPGPRDPARGQTAEHPRPARSGSARA